MSSTNQEDCCNDSFKEFVLAFICFLSFPRRCDGVLSCYFFRTDKMLLDVKKISVLLILLSEMYCYFSFMLGQR